MSRCRPFRSREVVMDACNDVHATARETFSRQCMHNKSTVYLLYGIQGWCVLVSALGVRFSHRSRHARSRCTGVGFNAMSRADITLPCTCRASSVTQASPPSDLNALVSLSVFASRKHNNLHRAVRLSIVHHSSEHHHKHRHGYQRIHQSGPSREQS